MPEKAGAAPPRDAPPAPAFRRASRDAIEEAARRLVRRGHREYATQADLIDAIRRELARIDQHLTVGARRLRRTLLDAGLARLRVTYAEHHDRRPLSACPVCGERLRPLVNRTLDGDRIRFGAACRRCGFWTHRRRRVPLRYTVRLVAGGPTGRSSG